MIEECPHCVRSVIFKVDSTCPACGKSKLVLPAKNRDQILDDQERDDLERKFTYYKKNGPRLMLAGTLLILVVIALILLAVTHGNGVIIWYGGILIGAGIVTKGYSQLTQAREFKILLDRKHERKK
jgi:hypothetical protein